MATHATAPGLVRASLAIRRAGLRDTGQHEPRRLSDRERLAAHADPDASRREGAGDVRGCAWYVH